MQVRAALSTGETRRDKMRRACSLTMTRLAGMPIQRSQDSLAVVKMHLACKYPRPRRTSEVKELPPGQTGGALPLWKRQNPGREAAG